jgi:hypothetical protein
MQLYASYEFLTDDARTIAGTTKGKRLTICFTIFASLLNIPIDGNFCGILNISNFFASMVGGALSPLRTPNVVITMDSVHSTSLLEPVYAMFMVILKTLVSKIGDREKVRNFPLTSWFGYTLMAVTGLIWRILFSKKSAWPFMFKIGDSYMHHLSK